MVISRLDFSLISELISPCSCSLRLYKLQTIFEAAVKILTLTFSALQVLSVPAQCHLLVHFAVWLTVGLPPQQWHFVTAGLADAKEQIL